VGGGELEFVAQSLQKPEERLLAKDLRDAWLLQAHGDAAVAQQDAAVFNDQPQRYPRRLKSRPELVADDGYMAGRPDVVRRR